MVQGMPIFMSTGFLTPLVVLQELLLGHLLSLAWVVIHLAVATTLGAIWMSSPYMAPN